MNTSSSTLLSTTVPPVASAAGQREDLVRRQLAVAGPTHRGDLPRRPLTIDQQARPALVELDIPCEDPRMPVDNFHDLFVASAGVAGALIGLLFVAISVAHERLTGDDAAPALRVRASTALTSFTNALSVSLFALVPGLGVGWTALIVSVLGLLFVAASLLSLLRVRRSHPGELRDAAFLIGIAVTFVVQLVGGVQAIAHPHDIGPVRTVAIVVIVCFLIGISRAWELVGGPTFGIRREIAALARARDADAE